MPPRGRGSGAQSRGQPPAPGLLKTELCRFYDTPQGCQRGDSCWFAHGRHELRQAAEQGSAAGRRRQPPPLPIVPGQPGGRTHTQPPQQRSPAQQQRQDRPGGGRGQQAPGQRPRSGGGQPSQPFFQPGVAELLDRYANGDVEEEEEESEGETEESFEEASTDESGYLSDDAQPQAPPSLDV
jgi:hypothetical protein